MGLDYSYEVLLKRQGLSGLLQEVSEYMTEDTEARRLRSALPWKPSRTKRVEPGRNGSTHVDVGISGFQEYEPTCVSLNFLEDEFLLESLSRGRQEVVQSSKGGFVPLGCIYISVCAGTTHALLSACAATTDMSRLFEESPSIRGFWEDRAKRVPNSLLIFDREGHRLEIFDGKWRTVDISFDASLSVDFRANDVDRTAEVLQSLLG